MLKDPVGTVSHSRLQALSYFIITVLGFSFWFFMAVPFASHRESYWWLGMVYSQDFTEAFSFISITYRPLAQAVTWLAFLILDPSVFPTSVLRQAALQGFIYGMFVLAWWLIYATVTERRLFALFAFVTGCVFFSGYVHLFHIYGIFYIPVMLTLGMLLRYHGSRALDNREVWLAVTATLLAFWHPFATALFVGFYFGLYLDTFGQRTRAQHVQAAVILLVGSMAIAAVVVLVPRADAMMPLHSRLVGFLVSYRTNEVNQVASFVAFLFTQLVVFGMGLSLKLRMTFFLLVSALSLVFFLKGLPLLLLWLGAVLIKLFQSRCWSLFFLTLAAALLPFGAGIGGPVSALFAIILAGYVTPLGWSRAERALSFVKSRYVTAVIIASVIVILAVRAGVDVPIVTRGAIPLLTERERTYQLESMLAWLRHSEYCGHEVSFAENAGSPIESVENVITRRNRPPAALGDVQLFWDAVVRCNRDVRPGNRRGTAVLTFGGPRLANSNPVFQVSGRYAGDATVWVADAQR